MRSVVASALAGLCALCVACGGSPARNSDPLPSPPIQGECGVTTPPGQTSLSTDYQGNSASSPLTIAVTPTDTRCTWTVTVTDGAGFVTIVDGASGTGNGTVKLTVAKNTGGQRTATIRVAGVAFTLTQTAAPCDFALSGDTAGVFASGGGTGTITITQTQGVSCSWTAASNAPFITVTSVASGTGSGNVTFSVAPNPDAQQRSGTLTIAGKSVTVAQNGTGSSPPPPTLFQLTVRAGDFLGPPTGGLYAIVGPNGLFCVNPTFCTVSFAAGTVVDLTTVVVSTRQTFGVQWLGCDLVDGHKPSGFPGANTGTTCRVTMNANKAVESTD